MPKKTFAHSPRASRLFVSSFTAAMLVVVLVVLTVVVLGSLVSVKAEASSKPFRRALVITGGGLNPGGAMGAIAGARAAGWEPDVIITTCGASISAGIDHAFDSTEKALQFAKSSAFHSELQNSVRLNRAFSLPIKKQFDQAAAQLGTLQPIFNGTILQIPETLKNRPGFAKLSNSHFKSTPGKPRLIMIGAEALFGPKQVGGVLRGTESFKQVFFTDADTARHLKGKTAAIKRMFPNSYIQKKTGVITNVALLDAARASVADPIYINPARIGGKYYFTGAIDLYPVETAKSLADEVLMTQPPQDWFEYERLPVLSTFGFDPVALAHAVRQTPGVFWMRTKGFSNFDPTPMGLIMRNNIPASSSGFAQKVESQYQAGYARAYEAVMHLKKIKKSRR